MPSPRRIRWVLRLLGWNALLLLVGVVLTAIAGEAYLRLTMPFAVSGSHRVRQVFVPNVGLLWPPNTELRFTNHLDYWNVSRTNSLGFLDREPPSPERAAATCHVSIIGDSFVDAVEVPINDKLQVRLEELAAHRLPHLNVTTSAFGLGNTGQIQQLPFYDEYARLLHPKLLALVFVPNDFTNNIEIRRYFLTPQRRPDGKLELAWSRPRNRIPSGPRPRLSWAARAMEEAVERSLLARWLRAKKRALSPTEHDWHRFQQDVEALRRQPGYAAMFEGWRSLRLRNMDRVFALRNLPPILEDTLQYTHFALEQFKQRADRDGASLVILAPYALTTHGTPTFERLSQIAATLDIPVIDQADYILRQGADLSEAHWPHDYHWNPAGHRWAAEVLLEYLEEHPATCGGPSGAVPAAGQAAADREGTHGVTPPSL